MVKTIFFSIIVLTTTTTAQTELQINCLNCHFKQKIPSELIYRRYLQKYSTHSTIKAKLLSYLKKPTQKNSIMPKQFFLKFPEKKALDLNQTILVKSINEYLDYFDIKNQLFLK